MTSSLASRALGLLAATTLLLGSAAVTASAAQAAPSAKKYPALIVTQESTQVRLTPGERIRIQLSTNRTTGYSWIAYGGCCTADDANIATISKGAYKAPVTDLVGAPGVTTWTVTAVRPGTTDITIVTRPPGVKNTMQDEQVAMIHLIVMEK
jgi:predicted secreted protein